MREKRLTSKKGPNESKASILAMFGWRLRVQHSITLKRKRRLDFVVEIFLNKDLYNCTHIDFEYHLVQKIFINTSVYTFIWTVIIQSNRPCWNISFYIFPQVQTIFFENITRFLSIYLLHRFLYDKWKQTFSSSLSLSLSLPPSFSHIDSLACLIIFVLSA